MKNCVTKLLVPLGCYLYSARKVDNTGYSSLISNAHKLKKYILINMNGCNRQLLLPSRTMASRETILL